MADEQQNDQQQQGQQGQQDGQQQEGQQQQDALTFDKWYGELADDVKGLLDDHTIGLKSALEDERRERKGLAARIKELSKSADQGSELQKQLETLTGQMGETETRATFYEGAHEAGVKNLRLAWIAAKEFDLISSKGDVNFDQLKQQAPELFASAKTVPNAHAGNGAQQPGMDKPDMNRAIRIMAGRQA